jgi:hypothetical protein
MKSYVIFIVILWVSLSCSKSKDGSLIDPTNTEKDSTGKTDPVNTKPGTFVSAPGETVTGTARISETNSSATLILENFSVNNGPDLHVYLAADLKATRFIDLGKLQKNSGSQQYAINGTVNFNTFKYVLIHCQQYNVLFGSALIN